MPPHQAYECFAHIFTLNGQIMLQTTTKVQTVFHNANTLLRPEGLLGDGGQADSTPHAEPEENNTHKCPHSGAEANATDQQPRAVFGMEVLGCRGAIPHLASGHTWRDHTISCFC